MRYHISKSANVHLLNPEKKKGKGQGRGAYRALVRISTLAVSPGLITKKETKSPTLHV